MKVSRFSEQQIALLLKQVDDGVSVEEVCRKAGISQQTYYRWCNKYGGLIPSEPTAHFFPKVCSLEILSDLMLTSVLKFEFRYKHRICTPRLNDPALHPPEHSSL